MQSHAGHPRCHSQYAPPPQEGMARDGSLAAKAYPQATRTTVHVDSRDRDFALHPDSSSFVIRLPEALKNVSSAVLVTAELPLTYYVFSAARGNTSLAVTVGATTATATIPDGNYTAAAMAEALQAALRAAFGGDAGISVTIDAVGQKCTVSHQSSNVRVEAAAAGAKNTDWGLGYHLGFPRGGTAGGTASATGTTVALLNPENYVLLDVAELNSVKQGAMYSAGGIGAQTFAKIPLNGNSYDYNFYDKAVTYVEQRPQLARVDRLTVSLRFHDGTLVDLNGGEWSFSVEFACTLARGA